jgi:hypothetical protein
MIRKRLREFRERELPKSDRYDYALLVAFGATILGAWIIDRMDGTFPVATYAVAFIGALTAWRAIYKMRHPDRPAPPDVRQDFELSEPSKVRDFGFRNFGPGPAIYIQFVARVDGEERVTLGPLERPIHLPEGEFVGIVDDRRVTGDLFKENENQGEVELYCAYGSVEGIRGPRNLDVPDDAPEKYLLDDLTELHPQPQHMRIERIRSELDT